uniref:Uncharacterized protein n=1 Tax=Glossina brevipalpis TaxID=37001 RepID=A0A1A9WBY0_9MUSC
MDIVVCKVVDTTDEHEPSSKHMPERLCSRHLISLQLDNSMMLLQQSLELSASFDRSLGEIFQLYDHKAGAQNYHMNARPGTNVLYQVLLHDTNDRKDH